MAPATDSEGVAHCARVRAGPRSPTRGRAGGRTPVPFPFPVSFPAVPALVVVAALLLVLPLATPQVGAQWPMEGRTAGRDAVTADDGPPAPEVLWTRTPGQDFGAGEEAFCAGDPDRVCASPVLGDGLVAIGTRGGRLAAYDAVTGQTAWDVRVPGSGNVGVEGAAAFADGRFVFGAFDGKVRAVDPTDGFVAWTLDVDSPVTTPVLAADGRVYFGTHDGRVRAVDAATGDTQWRDEASLATDGLRAGFAASEAFLYVPTRTFALVRYDLGTGAHLDRTFGAALPAAPAVADGTIYVAAEDDLYALNGTTLQTVWRAQNLIGDVRATPLVDGDRVYVGTDRGHLFALNASDGSIVWQQDLIGNQGSFSDDLRDQPVLAGGTLYVGSEQGLVFAVDPSDGSPLWTLNLAGDALDEHRLTAMAAFDGKLYVGREDGVLWVLGPPGAAGNVPPTARAEVWVRGLTVELDGRASTDVEDDADELAFEWDLGDGTEHGARFLAYTYREPGTYLVTLTVRDTGSRIGQFQREITVEETGRTAWRTDRAGPHRTGHSPDAAPKGWEVVWTEDHAGDPLVAGPLVDADRVYLLTDDGDLRALGLETGGELWSAQSSPFSDGLVLGDDAVVTVERRVLRARDAADGALMWAFTSPTEDLFDHATAHGGLVAATRGDRVLHLLDADPEAAVRVLWTADLPGPSRVAPLVDLDDGSGDAAGFAGASGLDPDATIYVLSVTNDLTAFAAANGSRRWSVDVGMEADDAALVPGNGTVVLAGQRADGNRGEVRALRTGNGSLLWSVPMDREVLAPAVDAAAGVVHVASLDDTLTAMNLSDGATRWRVDLDDAPTGGPVVADGLVLVPTEAGVEALDAGDGSAVFDGDLAAAVTGLALHDGLLAAAHGDAVSVVGRLPFRADLELQYAPPVRVGEDVIFQDASRAPTDAERTWHAGDGTVLRGVRVAHNYTLAGVYTVTLDVGADPTLVSRGTVQVLPAPTPPADDDGDGDGTPPPPPPDGDGDGDGNATDDGPPRIRIPGFSTATVMAAILAVAAGLALVGRRRGGRRR